MFKLTKNKDTNKEEPKKEEPKKAEIKKEEAKKAEIKKEETKKEETKKEPVPETSSEEEPWRAEWGQVHDRLRAVREKRRKEGLCVMCGKKLGFFDRYANRTEHEKCRKFIEDDAPTTPSKPTKPDKASKPGKSS